MNHEFDIVSLFNWKLPTHHNPHLQHYNLNPKNRKKYDIIASKLKNEMKLNKLKNKKV